MPGGKCPGEERVFLFSMGLGEKPHTMAGRTAGGGVSWTLLKLNL